MAQLRAGSSAGPHETHGRDRCGADAPMTPLPCREPVIVRDDHRGVRRIDAVTRHAHLAGSRRQASGLVADSDARARRPTRVAVAHEEIRA